jgi:hypothetical protein
LTEQLTGLDEAARRGASKIEEICVPSLRYALPKI